jgi:hypothetical protein
LAKGEKKAHEIDADVDELFKLPPDQFTAARNALAAKLKKNGHPAESADVKELARPPLSAWTVNQLFWRHRKAFDALLTAGDEFRQAQAAQMGGKPSDLRGTLETRRKALSTLSTLAAALLEQGGHSAGPDTMRRVMTTLEALSSFGTHPDAPVAGRLTADVDAPGFEALAALVPQSGRSSARGGEPRVLTFKQKPKPSKARLSPEEARQQEAAERKAEQAAAKAAVQDAEKTLRAARRGAEQAEAALKKAAAAAKQAEKDKREIEARYEKVTRAADEARQEARRVAAQAEEAAQAVEDAERALEKARRELTT